MFFGCASTSCASSSCQLEADQGCSRKSYLPASRCMVIASMLRFRWALPSIRFACTFCRSCLG
eukprot:4479861-Alexandrium_andersonii.AAC.1